MSNKSRLLHLLRLLQEETDQERAISTGEIRRALAEKGCLVTVETLRDDIQMLRDAGFDIAVNESSGRSTTYSFLDQPLDPPEVQILIDAVSSCQFLTQQKSRLLIDKLAGLAGPSRRAEMEPGILVSQHVKAPNEQLLYIVQAISEGIRQERKIAFQYYRYDLQKRRVPRQNGKIYVVSPYATVWKIDRYFLLGWSDERQRVTVFRVDRMGLPTLLEERRTPAPESFSLSDYTDKVFNMYDDGREAEVTLRCRPHIIDQLVEWFGPGVTPEHITAEGFDARVRVALSPSFYTWVLGFVGDMTIAGPPEVVAEYRALLQRALRELPNDKEDMPDD